MNEIGNDPGLPLILKNEEAKALMQEAIFARYKSPMSHVSVYMHNLREKLEKSLIGSAEKRVIFDVLDGRVIPPK